MDHFLPRMRFALMQVLPVLAILAWLPGNLWKLLALMLVWVLTFRRISKPELLLYLGVCAFFTAMNAAALRQGIFVFRTPDVLGMPWYELLMWGFYVLHLKRVFEGSSLPQGRRSVVWALALAYAAAFGSIPDAQVLLLVSGALLVLSLVIYRQPADYLYTTYMVLLGAAIEYTGVHSGQWSYPGNVWGGVPLWFVTMWGGVGLFARRLVLPLVVRAEQAAGIPAAAAA